MARFRVWSLLVCVGWLVSCAGADREACYADAEIAAAAKADRLCPTSWDDCQHRKAILLELSESYRRCP